VPGQWNKDYGSVDRFQAMGSLIDPHCLEEEIKREELQLKTHVFN